MVWFFKKKDKKQDKESDNTTEELLPDPLDQDQQEPSPEAEKAPVDPDTEDRGPEVEAPRLEDAPKPEAAQPEEPKQEQVEIVDKASDALIEDEEEVVQQSASVFAFDEGADETESSEDESEQKTGWFGRIRQGLSKSSSKISDSISAVLTKRKLDDGLIEELEEILITADLGPRTASKLVEQMAKDRYGKDIEAEEVKGLLADQMEAILKPVEKRLVIDPAKKPFVILMAGVNGAGKTTTIGKLGSMLKASGKSVLMAAGDTFRAAAIEQLTIWGERAGIDVYAKEIGSDAAALAYEAYQKALEQGSDVLIIDTAGRLQNKKNLMEELSKIVRVLKKHDAEAPHSRLIVLDATTGQNAHSQIEAFRETIDLTGLIITKLDGSAKGGVVVSLADQFNIPVHAIGVGEKIEDLRPFDARSYARSLMGLDTI